MQTIFLMDSIDISLKKLHGFRQAGRQQEE